MNALSPVRSLEPITVDDLIRLGDLARAAESRLFARNPQTAGRYAGRLICRALCQGAAAHYLDGQTGVKDFDVWSFYAIRDDGYPFPHRWHATADFGPSKFGRYRWDHETYQGRRVDLFGRSIQSPPGTNPVRAIRKYLTAGRSRTVRALADRPVVILWPVAYVGLTAWAGRVRGEELGPLSTTKTYTIWCDWKPPSGATGFCSNHVEGGSLLEARALARTSGWQLALRRKSGPPIEGPDYCSAHKTVRPRQ